MIKGDKIVFEDYQNGSTANTPNFLASGTKSFTGVILAAAPWLFGAALIAAWLLQRIVDGYQRHHADVGEGDARVEPEQLLECLPNVAIIIYNENTASTHGRILILAIG